MKVLLFYSRLHEIDVLTIILIYHYSNDIAHWRDTFSVRNMLIFDKPSPSHENLNNTMLLPWWRHGSVMTSRVICFDWGLYGDYSPSVVHVGEVSWLHHFVSLKSWKLMEIEARSKTWFNSQSNQLQIIKTCTSRSWLPITRVIPSSTERGTSPDTSRLIFRSTKIDATALNSGNSYIV